MNPTRSKNSEFDEPFDPRIQAILDRFSDDQIAVPDGLADRIISTAKSPQRTVEALLNDFVAERPSRRRIIFNRFADFAATAAAILLIGSATLLSSGYVRQQARRALCAQNLGTLGSAVSSYARDYLNQLPYAKGLANEAWYDPANNQPHRAHLFVLVKGNYVAPVSLICPQDSNGTNPFSAQDLASLSDFPANAVVSYSFQNLNGDQKLSPRLRQMRWEQAPNMAIMADRTPLLSRNTFRPVADFEKALSDNHAGLRGQNILVLDGRVTWQTAPTFGPQRDNIWQAGNIQQYSGREVPASCIDSFLAP